MADEKKGRRGGPECFELGASYDEVGPDLGRLYDAWQVDTGQPALEFQPSDRVLWKPSADYDVRITCQRSSSVLRLRIEGATAPISGPDLANIFAWMKAVAQRVEHSPRFIAQLTPSPLSARVLLARYPRPIAFVLLIAGVVWLHLSPTAPSRGESTGRHAPPDAPFLVDTETPSPDALSYPLPDKPFRNQAVAPCKPQLDELEMNGGCWVELGRRPPCNAVQAEHQGKCYLPVSKDRGRLPSTVEP
ncbi:hypothetical protein [Melittangium boletus]|uniref:hypothetical protein n=1 Tax=Melittangium boletus TaxID=83453 RepID=UPI003DA5A0B1